MNTFLQKYYLTVEDYYDLVAIGLCKAGSKFDDNKSKFSTYGYKCMFTAVLQRSEIKRQRKEYKTISLYIIKLNLMIVMVAIHSRLKDRDKQIFVLLTEGCKQEEIGKIVGCSSANVSRVRKKLCKNLAN